MNIRLLTVLQPSSYNNIAHIVYNSVQSSKSCIKMSSHPTSLLPHRKNPMSPAICQPKCCCYCKTPQQPSAMDAILQMQQQQQAMQQKMTYLTARLFPHEKPPIVYCHKPQCPCIEGDSSDNKWVIFTESWHRYKEIANFSIP